jgi:hypothetical protein
VSCNVLDTSQQIVAWRGAWENVPQSIKQNETRMIRLDVSAQNLKHQPYMRGKVIMKEKTNDE